MENKVGMFIEKIKREAREKELAERNERLVNLGLYEKEYVDERSEEYPNYQWDPGSQKARYYKVVPLTVTDDEYAEILKYIADNKPAYNEENIGSDIIKCGGIVLKLGVAISVILAFVMLVCALAYKGMAAVLGIGAVICLLFGVLVSVVLGKLIQGFGDLICTTKRIENNVKK